MRAGLEENAEKYRSRTRHLFTMGDAHLLGFRCHNSSQRRHERTTPPHDRVTHSRASGGLTICDVRTAARRRISIDHHLTIPPLTQIDPRVRKKNCDSAIQIHRIFH
ncbi:jg16136 [Pararge aegeria aegeria]|uniref:Jg16136 protein n=1 Tax=Pararge aegeria aegeria TaxID=348720 RepID=A0A8S4RE53_9NEOP|nr:jg16136 [Pararge aegeria aegeria]